MWVAGRIYCTGTPADYAKVQALQDKLSVVPLSSYGKTYTPPAGEVDASFDMTTGIREQVNKMGVNEFFEYLAKAMKTNPPSADDAPLVARMATIGLVPGQGFDASKLGGLDQEAIKAVPKVTQLKMLEYFKHGSKVNGWAMLGKTGQYGTDYMQRAMVALIGLGANLSQDSIYPIGETDADGKELDGASNKYVVHFDKGLMPPAKAFWSLTMYDDKYFFVPNAINRYTLSSRDTFVKNTNGSVNLYFQADSPGKAKEANWLPAPKAKLVPMLRLYWPKDTPPSILDGTWKPPAITRVQVAP